MIQLRETQPEGPNVCRSILEAII